MNDEMNDLKLRCLTSAIGYSLSPGYGFITEHMYGHGDGEKYCKFIVWLDEENKKVVARMLDPTEELFKFDAGQEVLIIKEDENVKYYPVRS